MEVRRVFDCLPYQNENYPLDKAFGYQKNGKWIYYSTAEMLDMANKVSMGLIKMGVQPGDRIALIVYRNRPEWVAMDVGISQIGAINVPVYPTISPGEYEYIFNDSEVQYAFVGADDLVDKVNTAKPNIPTLKEIYAFDEEINAPHWTSMFSEEGMEEVEARKAAIESNQLATIIYTSGTTGNPKGVMLSHDNIVSNVMAVRELLPMDHGDKVLSFLPLCHIFERTASYSYTNHGVSVSFCGTDELGGEDGALQTVKPHFFTTVPRLLEKVYERIYNRGLDLTGVKRSLFFWALGLTDDYDYDKKYSGWAQIQRNIADRLIFSKWREALGGNVIGILTGAAPLPKKMARVFSAAGVPIREAYGLTETSPGLTINRFSEGECMLGSTGMTIKDVQVRIDPDGDYREGEGEILATGPNVMMGYYKKQEATDAVIFEENGTRWFRTGDVGKLVKNSYGNEFLVITDRKKELLKTSGGKYVAPAPIENRLKESFLIEQVMVVGESKKFVSALIVPAEEALKDWCDNNGVGWSGVADAIQNDKVLAHYQTIINETNPEFSKIEQIKKFMLVDGTWDAMKTDGSEAELTPTMKLKRRVIRKKYQPLINNIYAD
ncbi:MAG: long-chain fatty acid--CoA ligase [Bacteroidota bacterium]